MTAIIETDVGHLIDEDELSRARKVVSAFVAESAKQRANQLGFGWTATPDAPDTYPALTEAYDLSKSSGKPLPVSSLYCDTTIFPTPELNYAMRFWHDTFHMDTKLTFSLDDELELGLHHLREAEKAGLPKHSVPWQMIRIDLLGQNYLLGIAKRFPLNQRDFVEGCLLYGLDEGVLREARKVDFIFN